MLCFCSAFWIKKKIICAITLPRISTFRLAVWIWTSGPQFISLLYHLCSVLRARVCLLLKYIAPLYLTLTTLCNSTVLGYNATDRLFFLNSRLYIIFSFLASLYALLQSITTESMAIKQLAWLMPFVTLPFRHRDGVFLGGWQYRPFTHREMALVSFTTRASVFCMG